MAAAKTNLSQIEDRIGRESVDQLIDYFTKLEQLVDQLQRTSLISSIWRKWRRPFRHRHWFQSETNYCGTTKCGLLVVSLLPTHRFENGKLPLSRKTRFVFLLP